MADDHPTTDADDDEYGEVPTDAPVSDDLGTAGADISGPVAGDD
jgi:hypothetical protein